MPSITKSRLAIINLLPTPILNFLVLAALIIITIQMVQNTIDNKIDILPILRLRFDIIGFLPTLFRASSQD